MSDTYDLERFASAQADVYETALSELRAGQKRSHWMWYVFPQLQGLGRSPTARAFALRSLGEAKAYLEHPLLGPRLRTCTRAVLAHKNRSAQAIFGYPDVLKFRSCMTLFTQLEEVPFSEALAVHYGGEPDERTLELLSEQP